MRGGEASVPIEARGVLSLRKHEGGIPGSPLGFIEAVLAQTTTVHHFPTFFKKLRKTSEPMRGFSSQIAVPMFRAFAAVRPPF
jgi:hypothetical protein